MSEARVLGATEAAVEATEPVAERARARRERTRADGVRADAPACRRPTVLFVNVRDRTYPRHQRLAAYFATEGYLVETIDRRRLGGPRSLRPVQRPLRLMCQALRRGRRWDVVVLAEFSIQYAVVTWLVARLSGAVHVVDGFVGLHETLVADRATIDPASARARALALFDRLSYRLADVYLIDTDRRAKDVVDRLGGRTSVVALPVGAPSWARLPPRARDAREPLAVLYYGNFIPLHGVDHLIRSVATASSEVALQLTLVGRGQTLCAARSLVDQLGLRGIVRFQPPVLADQLAGLMGSHDVVAGVFGTSNKAVSVIPNKVWQGLSAGAIVTTGRTEALAEIRGLVGGMLVEVDVTCVSSLASCLVDLADRKLRGELPAADVDVHDRLEHYVRSRYGHLGAFLDQRGAAGVTHVRREEVDRC